MAYWLMKSEPGVYSIDDLKAEKKTSWDGVRNYQARNFMRDAMKKGDGVLFYHSNKSPQIAGIAKVSKEAYPDHTQFESKSKYYDPKATPEEPRWWMVDIAFVKALPEPLLLSELRTIKELEDMPLLQKGQRLSVQPLETKHWKCICKLAGIKSTVV